MFSAVRDPKWVANLRVRPATNAGTHAHTGRTRRPWPYVVTLLVGLVLLYVAPAATLIAVFTLLAVAGGVVVWQRRLRRREAASTNAY